MNRRAFTLIALLAVIVILAIIALIAVPIVINIINDSKKESINRSIELYIDHVQKMIAKEQMQNPTFNPSECEIKPEGKLLCGTKEIQIEMKGQMPKSGKIKFSKGMVVEGINLELDNLYYQVKDDKVSEGTKEKVKSYSDYITRKEDTGTSGLSVGDEYTYKVNATDTFTFYVLSIKGDEVNLIMDSNICNDGTIPTSSKPCLYAWHWQTQEWDENDNRYGPDIAMTNLYNGTKGWINVPDMIMDYDDENNKTDDTKGYTSIMTDETTKVTTITGKQNKTSTNQTFGNTTEPLKARLPREDEVKPSDNSLCTTSQGSCPMWLVKNLNYWNGANNKYSDNQNNGITNIYGYWLLSSNPGDSYRARYVYYNGIVSRYSTSNASFYGLRPVITVSLSDLSS